MKPERLAGQIEAIILAGDARFASAVEKVQTDLFNQLSLQLKDLETDQDGYILQSANNRKVLANAENTILQVFRDPYYVGAVTNYLGAIPKINDLNEEYFTSVSDSFKPNRVYLKSLQQQTISSVEKYILQDGLESQVVEPLVSILNQNINSGGKFTGFMEQVKTFVEGNDKVDGRAESYTRTYLRDTLFTYSRSYQQAVTSDLKLEWYLYAGGLMDKSRPFCIERAGKYFRHDEIEAWASLEWQGKKPDTTESSIFIYVAGWNCNHQLIPVSKIIVPAEDLARFK